MYKNLECFIYWLKRVSKKEVNQTYIDQTLEELKKQNANNNCPWFELAKFETKSGNPEIYSYKTEIEEDKDENFIIIYVF